MDINVLAVFKALADPTRLRIINLLLGQELNVNEIVQTLQTGQSGISRHLKILSDSGLVRRRKDGLWSFFSAAADGEQGVLLRHLESLFASEPQMQGDAKTAEQALAKRSQASRDLFDALAPRWEDMKREVLGDFDLNRTIIEQLGQAGTVADLGCGTGDLTEIIGVIARKVIGVDSSPEMIRTARSRFFGRNGKMEIRMGEIDHLPLANGEADAAVCSMVLHHLPDPLRSLGEVARIIKPGGVFILADLNTHDNEFLRKKYGDRRLGFSKKTLETWLGKAGFEKKDMKQYPVKRNLTVLLFSAVKK